MTIGISAPAARQREQTQSSRSWQTVSLSGVSPQALSGTEGHATAPRISWLGKRRSAVGGAAKRGFDVIAASTAIITLLPLFCLLALAIKAWDGGPVLYRHRRIGLDGRGFNCLKFRTMVANADEVLVHHLATNGEAAREWQEDHKLKCD